MGLPRGALAHVDRQVVVGQVDMWRQGGLDGGMETHFVAHVGDEGLGGFALFDDLERLGKTEVGEVLLLA